MSGLSIIASLAERNGAVFLATPDLASQLSIVCPRRGHAIRWWFLRWVITVGRWRPDPSAARFRDAPSLVSDSEPLSGSVFDTEVGFGTCC
jgi:hypothetical protein